MPIETVRVAILNTEVVPDFVDGAVMRVFDMAGDLVTSVVSGEQVLEGTAEVELEGGDPPTEYLLRFYRSGAAIKPQRIAVYSPSSASPTGTNDFTVSAEVFTPKPATDPKMCRCSGYILGPSGLPIPGADITFIPRYYAFVDDARVALTGRFVVRTDKTGFVSVDLYRHGQYTVTIEGKEYVARDIEIPNRSSIVIGHLFFPVVAAVQYEEAAPFTVRVNENLWLTPHVRATDFRDLGAAPADVLFSVSDQSMASVSVYESRILVRGISTGTTRLRATRLDNSVVYLPAVGIAGGDVPLVITV